MAKRRTFTPEFKAELVSKSSAVRLPKQNCVGEPHNLNENQLSQWKRQFIRNASSLFDSADKSSSDAEKRIAHCTAIGNSDHSLNQDCGTNTLMERASDGETKTKKISPQV